MATSGSVDFSVSRNQIIEGALQVVGEYEPGETVDPEDITTCAFWLNLIVKQWQGTADFAPGLKTWSRKRGYVFLQKDTVQYSLGPSGDRAATSYASTTTSASANSGASSVVVTSASGISNGDYIGVELSTGALQWTTVNGAPAGSTVTLTATLTAAVASGARVFTYASTAQIRRPIAILAAELRDTDTRDTPLRMMDLRQYESLPGKIEDGTPGAWFYEEQLTNGVMYLDAAPTDVTDVVRIVYLSNIEDFDAASDTPDYPQEAYMALVMELAKYIAPVFFREFSPGMMQNRNDAVAIFKNLNPDTSSIYFEPGRE